MTTPAFQFYPADFLTDENVAVMTNEEVGCYIKLLCYCWREGSIPAETGKIARLCGVDGSAMAVLWPAIEKCFTSATDQPGRLTHPRLEEERKKQEEYRSKKANAGATGAKSRWANKKQKMAVPSVCHKQNDDSATVLPMANDSSSSSSSISTINIKGGSHPSLQEVQTKAGFIGCPTDQAELFWNHYESMGWVDANGNPILKWEQKLSVWLSKWREKKDQQRHSPSTTRQASVYELTKAQEAKVELAAKIYKQYASEVAGGDVVWSNDAKRKDWAQLRREINELRERVASAV